MTERVSPTAELVTPGDLADAACAHCCRYGKPEDESLRRGRLRAVQRSASALELALEQFRLKGAAHLRGEHSSADMSAEASALYSPLADWSFSVNAAADAHRRCGGLSPESR